MNKSIFLGFNWKLNPNSLEATQALLESYTELNLADHLDVCIFPPSVYLHQVSEVSVVNPSLNFGPQTVSSYESGAYTGDLSIISAKDLGAKYALIGHSETRTLQGLTNSDISLKVKLTLDQGLIPVLCIGYQEDKRSKEINFDELKTQLEVGLEGVQKDFINNESTASTNAKIIIAYEPVWAIGTGKTATKDQISEVVEFILKTFTNIFKGDLKDKVSVVYGGSVDDSNCQDLLTIPNIGGFLIGGASLKPEKMAKIVKSLSSEM